MSQSESFLTSFYAYAFFYSWDYNRTIKFHLYSLDCFYESEICDPSIVIKVYLHNLRKRNEPTIPQEVLGIFYVESVYFPSGFNKARYLMCVRIHLPLMFLTMLNNISIRSSGYTYVARYHVSPHWSSIISNTKWSSIYLARCPC